MRTRDQTEMNHAFVRVGEFKGCCFDGVDITYQIRDGNIRGSKLFYVTLIPMQPRDRRIITFFLDKIYGIAGNRCQGIVIDFTSFNHGHVLVQ